MDRLYREPLRVFVSSTYEDLQEERRTVRDVLDRLREAHVHTRLSIEFVGMELFPGNTHPSKKVMLSSLDTCQIYVGIIGWRYGSIDPETDCSMTRIEYSHAIEKGKEILIYLKSEEAAVPVRFVDRYEPASTKLRDFRRELEARHQRSEFKTPDELAKQLLIDLQPFVTEALHSEQTEPVIPSLDIELLEPLEKLVLQGLALFTPDATEEALIFVLDHHPLPIKLWADLTGRLIQFDDITNRVGIQKDIRPQVIMTLQGQLRRQMLERFVSFYLNYLRDNLRKREKNIAEYSPDTDLEAIPEEERYEVIIKNYNLEQANLQNAVEYAEELGFEQDAEDIRAVIESVTLSPIDTEG